MVAVVETIANQGVEILVVLVVVDLAVVQPVMLVAQEQPGRDTPAAPDSTAPITMVVAVVVVLVELVQTEQQQLVEMEESVLQVQ